jgi:hypothetical protein
MFLNTVRNITPEAIGSMTAVIPKIMKGGVKEAMLHAVNNTIQPVIVGILTNPEFVMPTDDGEEDNEAVCEQTDILDEPEISE